MQRVRAAQSGVMRMQTPLPHQETLRTRVNRRPETTSPGIPAPWLSFFLHD